VQSSNVRQTASLPFCRQFERYDDELIVSALWLTLQTFAVYAMVICDVFGYEFQGHSKISAYLILARRMYKTNDSACTVHHGSGAGASSRGKSEY
jgi:hypothetical protein